MLPLRQVSFSALLEQRGTHGGLLDTHAHTSSRKALLIYILAFESSARPGRLGFVMCGVRALGCVLWGGSKMKPCR